MAISRSQMYRQLKNRGGIMQLEPRNQYLFGGLIKSAKKAVKGVAGGIKDIISSDVGKMALLAAGGYYLGGGNLFGLQRAGMSGFSLGNLPGASLFAKGPAASARDLYMGAAGKTGLKQAAGGLGIGKLLTGSALIGSLFGGDMQQAQEMYQRNPDVIRQYLRQYYENINPDADPMQVDRFVEGQMSEYAAKQDLADGGRVGFEEGGGEFLTEEQAMEMYPGMFVNEGGDEPSDLMELLGKYYTFKKSAKGVGNDTKQYFYNTIKKEAEEQGYDLNDFVRFAEEQAPIYEPREEKMGGGMPMGIMRLNQAGVKERDYREEGGFVPVGIKEKADDVPAMLSKNEFVMTADAVRGAGNGDVEKGAQRMYRVMKTLENGGRI